MLAIIDHSKLFQTLANYFPVILIGVLSVVIMGGLALISSKLLVEGVRGHRLRFRQSISPLKKIWVMIIYGLVYLAVIFGSIGLLVVLALGNGPAHPYLRRRPVLSALRFSSSWFICLSDGHS